MKKIVALVTLLAISATAPVYAQILWGGNAGALLPATYANPVGVNLAAGGSTFLAYENFPIFEDHVRESNAFQVATSPSNCGGAGGVQAAVDASGWPTVDFCVSFHQDTNNAPQGWYYNGTPGALKFACGYTGTGSETITGYQSAAISNIVNTSGVVTFDVAMNGSGSGGYTLTGTTGGATDIYCYLPEYRGGALTFTAGPGSGAKSATLTSTWASATGQYLFTFSDAEQFVGYLTNGSTAATWSTGLSGSVTTAAKANGTYSSLTLSTTEAVNFYKQFSYIRLMWEENSWFNTAFTTSSNRRTPANTKAPSGLWSPIGGGVYAFTAAPTTGATSATLTAPISSGYWSIRFSDGEDRLTYLASSSASVSWTGALTGATFTTSTILGRTEGYPADWFIDFVAACDAAGGKTGVWINSPINTDGTWVTAVATYAYNTLAPGIPVYDEPGNEIWNGCCGTVASWFSANQTLYAYANGGAYLANIVHGVATAAEAVYGSRFNHDFRVVTAVQAGANGIFEFGQPNGFFDTYAANGWNVANEVWAISNSNYLQPSSALSSGDSIATIESKVQGGMPDNFSTGALPEGFYVLGSHFKLAGGFVGYEAGWDSKFISGITNLTAAIMDTSVPGMAGAMTPFWQQAVDSGYASWAVFESGVWAGTNNPPGDEWSANWTAFTGSYATSPRYNAVQPFLTAWTPTRNVINGSGSVLAGINYQDNYSGISATLPTLGQNCCIAPYYQLGGYVGWHTNTTVSQSYDVVVNATNTCGSAETTSLELTRGNIVSTSESVAINGGVAGNNDFGTWPAGDFPAGPGYILLGNGTKHGCITVNSITFN